MCIWASAGKEYQGRIQYFWKGGSYGLGMGLRFAVFYLIFLKYPMKMKEFGLIDETKLFHFHRIHAFQNGGGGGQGGGFEQPPWIPSGTANEYHPNGQAYGLGHSIFTNNFWFPC